MKEISVNHNPRTYARANRNEDEILHRSGYAASSFTDGPKIHVVLDRCWEPGLTF